MKLKNWNLSGDKNMRLGVRTLRNIHYAVLNEISSLRIIPQTILDVGCGNGSFTQTVSTTFPHSDITAIDTSIPKLFSPDNITFIQGSAEQLPFAS